MQEIQYEIILRNKITGEEISINEFYKIDDGDDEWVMFMWEEGNMSCDCNRGLHFGIENHPCGDEQFELVRIEKVNGKEKQS